MKILLPLIPALALVACGTPATTNDTAMDASNDTAMVGNDMAMGDDMASANGMAAAPGMAGGGAVTVTVSGVTADGGPVLVALQNEAGFAKAGGAYTTTVQPTTGSVTATFDGVTPGSYAAAVVQDTDKDGTLKIGATGPSEPYGFSGTAQTGAPTFGPAQFEVTATGGTANVALSAAK